LAGEKDSAVLEYGEATEEEVTSKERTRMDERSKTFFKKISNIFRKGRTNVK
jgi:hypothetical protein